MQATNNSLPLTSATENIKTISAETPLEPVKDVGDSQVATSQKSLKLNMHKIIFEKSC